MPVRPRTHVVALALSLTSNSHLPHHTTAHHSSAQPPNHQHPTTSTQPPQDQAAALTVPNAFGAALQRAGGVGLNATTSHDQTRYFVSLPANKLELWMALEAERFRWVAGCGDWVGGWVVFVVAGWVGGWRWVRVAGPAGSAAWWRMQGSCCCRHAESSRYDVEGRDRFAAGSDKPHFPPLLLPTLAPSCCPLLLPPPPAPSSCPLLLPLLPPQGSCVP